MDFYDIHATLWDTSDVTGATQRISSSHITLADDVWESEDQFSCIIEAIRKWSEMTISQ
jgi:hypothetical protein